MIKVKLLYAVPCSTCSQGLLSSLQSKKKKYKEQRKKKNENNSNYQVTVMHWGFTNYAHFEESLETLQVPGVKKTHG